MTEHTTARNQFLNNTVAIVCFVLLSPIILAVIVLYLIFRLTAGIFLHLAAWCIWCTRGRHILFVYSNSPHWKAYVEEQILARLGTQAVVLNWSERSRWKKGLAVLAFRYFGGSREFNPMAVVFKPFRVAKKFKFYQPFIEFKHGKPDAVKNMQQELFASLKGRSKRAA